MIPSKEEIKISAAIIAGGANKRFNGKTKANIQISGVRIITRAIKTLYEIFGDIIIVTNTPDEFKTCQQFTIVPDKIKNVGPLGGIHAALVLQKTKLSLFLQAICLVYLAILSDSISNFI